MRNPGKPVDLDKFWVTYDHVTNAKTSGVRDTQYCQIHLLSLNSFNAFKRKLELYNYYDKDRYDELCALVRDYMADLRISKQDFISNYDISEHELHEFQPHINYLKILEENRRPPEKTVSFIEITPAQPRIPAPVKIDYPESEVIHQQNDIQISITQGIKVLVSPSIDSMKIIKIIELLKDL
jgi:hypothetical protein